MLVRERADGTRSRTWVHRVKGKDRDTYLMLGHFPETSLEAARNEIRQQREQLSKGIDPARAAPRRRAPITPRTLSSAAVTDGHSIEFLTQEFMDRYITPNLKRPEHVRSMLDAAGLPYEIDSTLVRGLDYYTRTVFEFTCAATPRSAPSCRADQIGRAHV